MASNIEESSGSLEFPISLDGIPDADITLGCQITPGSATDPEDYTASSSGTITIPANSGVGYVASVSVSVVDDNVPESTETFTVTLTSATNATITLGTATGTITDVDSDTDFDTDFDTDTDSDSDTDYNTDTDINTPPEFDDADDPDTYEFSISGGSVGGAIVGYAGATDAETSADALQY